ncbi:MAG: pyridoxamine 5'-phosphate oxidase family protein [Bacteroidales bacterium]|nr:pyridoxamine 5'-phosphate oxidase family protein [Bacteroidales bacterium]
MGRLRTNLSEKELENIIRNCKVCYLSMVDLNGKPYVVPMNFGYENHTLFFHGYGEGKKIQILKINPNVCIAFSTSEELVWQHEDVACSYFMKYKSVLVEGKVYFVEDLEEKRKILNIIMKHYTGRDNFQYNIPALKNVCVFYVPIEKIQGRALKY